MQPKFIKLFFQRFQFAISLSHFHRYTKASPSSSHDGGTTRPLAARLFDLTEDHGNDNFSARPRLAINHMSGK